MAEEVACIDPTLIEGATALMAQLKASGLEIVTAESCTAGLVSAVLAQADGAGERLHGSFVTYTKANKTKALGVDAGRLAREGSVTAMVAEELACGALQRSPATLALSVTGVLGPDPDEDGNPVGLVYLGCCRRGRQPQVERKDYGPRPHDQLRRLVVLDALDFARTVAAQPS